MKLIHLTCCCLFLVLQVQAKKLKICLPKSSKTLNEVAGISFDKTFAELKKEINDEINFPGTFSTDFKLENVISANVSVSNITISGITNITICLFPHLLEPVNITMNSLKIQGSNYKLQGTVSDLFDIYGGNGSFQMDLTQFSIAATGLLPSLPWGCVTVNLGAKLQKMKVHFENIMDGDELLQPTLNAVIGDIFPDIIDYYWPTIYDTIEPYIQKIIDKYINKSELENLITILSRNDESIVRDNKKSCFNLSDIINA